jgi:4-carboxymuconolactone decarboxylase
VTERFPALAENELSETQRRVAAQIASGPRGGVRGPFIPLLRSPELAARIQGVGEYLRFAGGLPRYIIELAVLLTARTYGSAYEWQAHAPMAVKAGLPEAIVEAIGRGERPNSMTDEIADAYDFLQALLHKHDVDDRIFDRIHERFGDDGTIDLVAISGYYAMLAMVLNVARTALPVGKTAPFPAAFATAQS